MAVDPAVLAARWRRLDQAVAGARLAEQAGDYAMQDAVAAALNEVYDLWEAWHTTARLTRHQQDDAVMGDADGETTAALVYARGGKTHDGLEFSELLGYGLGRYGKGPYGASGWHWQPYADPRWSPRDAWYANRVEYQLVVPVLEAASRWLLARPELRQASIP